MLQMGFSFPRTGLWTIHLDTIEQALNSTDKTYGYNNSWFNK